MENVMTSLIEYNQFGSAEVIVGITATAAIFIAIVAGFIYKKYKKKDK